MGTFYGVTQGGIDILTAQYIETYSDVGLGSALAATYMAVYSTYDFSSWDDWTYNACTAYSGESYASTHGNTYAITYYYGQLNNIRAIEWI